MAYDECWGTDVANGNSQTRTNIDCIQQYIELGVPTDKLVVGFPVSERSERIMWHKNAKQLRAKLLYMATSTTELIFSNYSCSLASSVLFIVVWLEIHVRQYTP